MAVPRRIVSVAAAAAVTLAGLGALSPLTSAQAAPAADLMISAYVEGSSNNKALELYNPTTADLDLDGYTLELYVNGQTTTQSTLNLSGTLPSDGHYLITHNQWALGVTGDLSDAITNFNGDDTIILRNGAAVLDSIGQLGVDPGTNWSAGEGEAAVATSEMTLTKKACTVDTDPSDVYDPSVDFAANGQNDISTLGTFGCDPLVAAPDPGESPTPDPSETPDPSDLRIGDVQGTGDASPYVGQTVTLDAYVTATFQGTEAGREQFGGYYVQDAGDDDPATSDALFVHSPGAEERAVGEEVRITGTITESFGQTQLTPSSVEVLSVGNDVITPLELTVPVGDPERYEGMLVTFPQDLVILEYFNFDRFGEVVYGLERQWTPTALFAPGTVEASVLAARNAANRLIVDDGFNSQNISPAIHPNGEPFSRDNYFRGGDTVADLTGVMSYRNNTFKLQPTQGGEYTRVNERPAVPDVGGDFTVTSFNVLNYFTTLDSRGAVTAEDLERQQAKIVAALAEIDADVVGLMEIENNAPTAVDHLVAGLNAEMGAGTYDAIETGVQGSDEIFQAIIYKPATTEPVGDFAVMDLDDGRNRPSLLQTFRHRASGDLVSLSVNHLKSKGSGCGEGDDHPEQGSCNLTRVGFAEQLVDWLATDPTGQGSPRTIIMGDLNSYDHEDPIRVLLEAGYTDLEKRFNGERAYSYVFDGMLGYLDYAMADAGAAADVVGASSWHINADESDLFDYTTAFRAENEQALFAPDPYRSSDHDPVIVGLQLGDAPSPSPTPTPTPDPTVEPSPAPTVTVTASPAPGRDLYETPGFHTSDGRRWMTVCEPYSSQVNRCWTWIWASVVHQDGDHFVQVNGWAFNNLTYIGAPRSAWADNPLGRTGAWTALDGRAWRTECDTPATGRGGCRSYVMATVVERDGNSFRVVTKEVFNNQVRFG